MCSTWARTRSADTSSTTLISLIPAPGDFFPPFGISAGKTGRVNGGREML
jgi:hypothetical protein